MPSKPKSPRPARRELYHLAFAQAPDWVDFAGGQGTIRSAGATRCHCPVFKCEFVEWLALRSVDNYRQAMSVAVRLMLARKLSSVLS